MFALFRNLKFKNKIALLCIFLIAGSSLFSALFLYRYVAYQTRETAYVNSADLMAQAGNFFDEKLKGIIRRVFALQLNDNFHKSLSKFLFNEEKYQYALTLSQVSSSFAEIRSTEAFISSIFMYTPKGEFFDSSKIKNHHFNFKKSQLYQELPQMLDSLILWGQNRKDQIYLERKMVVPFIVRFSIEGYNGDILLVINLDQQAIINYLTNIYSGEGNWILILDNYGREVVSGHDPITRMFMRDQAAIKKIAAGDRGRIKCRYGTGNYIINYQGMTVAPWKIVNIQSERVLLKKINSFGIFLLLLTIAIVVICLIFALILANSITHPLALLENTIKKVTQRDFNVKFNYNYRDEVGQLGKSFNFMVEEIRELIHKLNDYIARLQEEKEKVKKEQILKRRAELKALQAQINPHFLYNTLDSIHWMADKMNASDISRMTMALGTLFRTGLNKGHEMIGIKDEIENVRSYLVIQKMRYGDQFDYVIDVDARLENLMTVKLILQPIIENAIYHGIKEKEATGRIVIDGRKTENGTDIEFIIKDDGLGINPIKLDFINQRLEQGKADDRIMAEREGYGIYNVNERIKLYFGLKYGLKFYSEMGKGTEVRILIPAVRKEEISNYV